MSAGALSLESGDFINHNRSDKKRSCDCLNVDIEHILRDIVKFRKNRKRQIKELQEDGDIILEDPHLQKKVKYDYIDLKIGDEKDDSSIQDEIGNIDSNSDEGSDYKYSKMDKMNETDCIKSRLDNSDSNLILKKEEECNKELKNIEYCVDVILDNAMKCNQFDKVKKNMISIIQDFIQAKYIQKDYTNEHIHKKDKEIESLRKYQKTLKNAVIWQHKMILQSQKIIENQKNQLTKKTEELMQIKSKVHQYIYECNNPPNNTCSKIYPDVY